MEYLSKDPERKSPTERRSKSGECDQPAAVSLQPDRTVLGGRRFRRRSRWRNQFRRAGQFLGDVSDKLRHPEVHPVLQECHQAVDQDEILAKGHHLPAHAEDHAPAHIAEFDLFLCAPGGIA